MQKKTKIAFVIHSLEVGGSEKFMIYLANEFYKGGYSPVVISLSDDNPLVNDLNANIKFVKITRSFYFDISISKKIKRVIQKESIDRIFCVGSFAFFVTKLFLRSLKIKFYLSLHTTQPKSVKAYLMHILFLRTVSKKDTVIFTSVNQKNYYHQKYFLSRKHNIVILNGINVSHFNPIHFDQNLKALRYNYNYKESDKLLLMVATIRPEKGHFYAIDALKILRQEYHQTDAFLLLVGGGEMEYIRKLKEHARKNGLKDFVHFKGNYSDVREFYYMADLFTLTSHSGETFSFAALEAMAFGLPCSLTEIGGANEMAIEGKTGVLSESKNPQSIAESWNRLLKNHLHPQKIRQFVVDNFDSKRMLEDYFQLIEGTSNKNKFVKQ